MTVQTETFFAGPSLEARIHNLRARINDALARRKVYRDTLAELESLGSRELNDIGIAPTMIREIAREAAYGK